MTIIEAFLILITALSGTFAICLCIIAYEVFFLGEFNKPPLGDLGESEEENETII